MIHKVSPFINFGAKMKESNKKPMVYLTDRTTSTGNVYYYARIKYYLEGERLEKSIKLGQDKADADREIEKLKIRYEDIVKSFAVEKQQEIDSKVGGIPMTIRSAIEEYLAEKKLDSAPRTIETYATSLQFFLDFILSIKSDPVMISDIKTADINAFKQSLAKKGNSPNTQHCRMRVIKSMIKWLALMEYIDVTPNFIMPKVPPKTDNIYFPNDQFEAVLSFLDPLQKKIALAYRATGLRLGETQKCKLEDKGEGRWRIITDKATSKTKRSRLVPCSGESACTIMELQKRLESYNHTGIRNAYRHYVQRPFRNACKKASAQFPEIAEKKKHFHNLRDTYGTRLYYETMDPLMVKTRLGHKNMNTTEIYLDWNEDLAEHFPDIKPLSRNSKGH
jgi:integrase